MTKLPGKSVTSNTARITTRNCTKACSFQTSFGSPMQRPTNCTERVTSSQCVVQIILLYDTRTVLVIFRTVGTEVGEFGYILYGFHDVLHFFNTNTTAVVMGFICFVGDDCDWAYTTKIVSQYTATNFAQVFSALRPLVFEASNTTVSQCFSQGNPINCTNGRCIASVDEDSSTFNRSCSSSAGSSASFDVRRRRIFPTPVIGNTNAFSYLCNRNLCNDPNNTNAVKNIIQSYASFFDIPPLSGRASIFDHHGNYLILLSVILSFTGSPKKWHDSSISYANNSSN